jgi:hypothetical protein
MLRQFLNTARTWGIGERGQLLPFGSRGSLNKVRIMAGGG